MVQGVTPPLAQRPPTPRWVIVMAITGLVLLAAIVIILLTTSGHGPGRHTP